MVGRWLLIGMWTVVALSVSLVAGGTIYVWLRMISARPGQGAAATTDWFFYAMVVAIPALTTLAVFVRGISGRMPGTARRPGSGAQPCADDTSKIQPADGHTR